MLRAVRAAQNGHGSLPDPAIQPAPAGRPPLIQRAAIQAAKAQRPAQDDNKSEPFAARFLELHRNGGEQGECRAEVHIIGKLSCKGSVESGVARPDWPENVGHSHAMAAARFLAMKRKISLNCELRVHDQNRPGQRLNRVPSWPASDCPGRRIDTSGQCVS